MEAPTYRGRTSVRINGLVVTALIAVGVYYAMEKVKGGTGGMRKGI